MSRIYRRQRKPKIAVQHFGRSRVRPCSDPKTGNVSIQIPIGGGKALDALHPIGHVGEPDDVAYGILYLASDESKFVTDSELVIDGGYTAR
ncbi:MAG: SDR family oxidoreductase [Leptolyngbyaceae bacterium]|nr:SDR family oxidoreductase [Leptolyngbyaceae bacterium]